MNKNKKNAKAAAQEPVKETAEETVDKAEVETENTDEKAEETAMEETPADDSAKKIEELNSQIKAEQDKYMRLFAEFDNFRKRTSKEKTEAYGDATAKTIGELLPALDNFERALGTPCSDENFKKGIDMIFSQLTGILEKLGVSEIEALNKPFDPQYHNAIKQAESDELDSDTVCEVFQKGYKLGDRIIRHAMVSVTV
ncbi:MAG: nucleotide exchange factor GrpE [Oscillospiraceae bacterium]|nr:nucleotide exchange factor GrpE [Oscillospiraceae bacterium]